MGQSTANVELGMEQATIEGVEPAQTRFVGIIAILQDLQEEVNYLPEGALLRRGAPGHPISGYTAWLRSPP
jgi:hypothetical protein